MADLDAHRLATLQSVLHGPGSTPAALRQAVASGDAPEALHTLVQKIRAHAYKVTDEDFDALRPHYTEDQLFELVVATALGAADARLQAAFQALDQTEDR